MNEYNKHKTKDENRQVIHIWESIDNERIDEQWRKFCFLENLKDATFIFIIVSIVAAILIKLLVNFLSTM